MEARHPELFRDYTGESWDRLFSLMQDVPSGPSRAAQRPPRAPSDVKRLPASDKHLLGCRPETDPFYTVVCEICGLLVLPQALRRHMERRHSAASIATLRSKTAKLTLTPTKRPKPAATTSALADANDEGSLPDSDVSNVVCSICSLVIPSTAFRRHTLKVHGDDCPAKPILSATLKIKTAKKSSPSKKSTSKSVCASPPELTDEISKDLKKAKSKSCKSPVPPELEPILPAPVKRPASAGGGPPDLLPADQHKKTSKKKSERKTDKIYDPNKNCGVINETGKPCLRSIFCKNHLVAHKRAVLNRSMPFDTLAKIMKSQTDAEKRPKQEPPSPVQIPPTIVEHPREIPQLSVIEVAPLDAWPEEPIIIKEEEPVGKRVKTDEVELDLDLPSDLDALIEATLKDVVDSEPLPILPVIPRPEPVLRWSLEAPESPPTPPPPPVMVADLPWHPMHPRPVATNTFGCRLVGGLLTKSKKLDEFRKQVQSVWGAPSSPSETKAISSFGQKSGITSPVKKPVVAASRRKRKSSGSNSGGGATPDLITGLLQRAAAANAAAANNATAAPPNGVNGVPVRLYNNNLSGSQPTFIQLNLCPSK